MKELKELVLRTSGGVSLQSKKHSAQSPEARVFQVRPGEAKQVKWWGRGMANVNNIRK